MKKFLAVVLLIASGGTFSHTEGIYGETRDYHSEREILRRIDHELHALGTLIKEGEHRRNAGSRIKFDYPGLKHDINVVRHGIQQYLKKPNREPRHVKSLRGDYIR